MPRRTLGIGLMVVGVLVVIAALGADALGLGAKAGVGWKQALGAVVGVIIVAVGAWYWPGFPRSRMMAEAAPATSRTPQKSGSPAAGGKPRTAKSSGRSVREGTSRGSRRRGKK